MFEHILDFNFEKSNSVSSSSSTASGPTSRTKSSIPSTTNLINKIEEIISERKRRCRSGESEEPFLEVDKSEKNGEDEIADDEDDDDDEIIFASKPGLKPFKGQHHRGRLT